MHEKNPNQFSFGIIMQSLIFQMHWTVFDKTYKEMNFLIYEIRGVRKGVAEGAAAPPVLWDFHSPTFLEISPQNARN